MTGNTKVWRAPLAGLAAVAMLATMGLASSTAVAADADPAGAVTLNANGGKFVGSNPGNGDGTLTYWEGADATPNNGRLETSTTVRTRSRLTARSLPVGSSRTALHRSRPARS